MKARSIGKKRGFATIEMLIAFTVVILCISAVIMVTFGNQSVSVDTQLSNEATSKAQAMLEKARADSRQDFSSVVSIPSFPDVSGPITYTNTLTVTDIDSYTKLAKSTVTWEENGRILSSFFSTILTDSSGATGGDTCNPILSGDWSHPQLLGTADIGQNNVGTDVYVFNKKAYLTGNPSAQDKSNFFIVDVSNPNLANLPILSSIYTGPAHSSIGLNAVHVAGKYAYVAYQSQTAQLQVIDISVPSAPTVVASLDVTSAGDTAVGNSIFYANKKIYLGLTKSTGPEFHVIDVSNPLAPTVKASFEINSQISAIIVKNGFVYLAVPNDPSTVGISEQLKVLDVSQADSGIITRVNTFSQNPSTMSGEGLYVSKDGKTLYLGEGGPSNVPELFSLDITNPATIPPPLKSKYINATVNAIFVRNNLAFLWTSDPNSGFQIWDLNNLNTIYSSLNTQQNATGGFDCDGNFVYTVQKSNKALQIIGPGP